MAPRTAVWGFRLQAKTLNKQWLVVKTALHVSQRDRSVTKPKVAVTAHPAHTVPFGPHRGLT